MPRIAKLATLLALVVAASSLLAVRLGGGAEAAPPTASKAASRGPVVLAFGGDIHFEGAAGEELAADPKLVLASIAPVLQQADLAVVNLETAVTDRGSAVAKQFVFRAPPTAFPALRAGGVDVASMANNHGMDFGESGLRDSVAAAKRARFPVIGIGLNAKQAYRPFQRTINGQRIAVIGATQVLDDELVSAWSAGPHKPGLASAKDVPRLLREVRTARRTSDTVVVFLHWGVELAQCPSETQRTLAKQLVAAGADVIVGGHAHRVQGAGRLGGSLVDYGLGNFVWYASGGLSTETGVLLVTVDGRQVEGYRWQPARIVDATPRPLSGTARKAAIASWNRLRSCTGLKP